MANDYTSFTGSELPPMPSGGLAGLLSYERDIKSRKAKELSLMQMMLSNQMRQAELQRYQGQTPGMVAGSELEEILARNAMNTPGFGPQMARGRMGTAMSQEAQGRTAASNVDTVPGTIPPLGQTQSPMETQMVYQNFVKKLPKDLQDVLPPTYTPNVRNILEKELAERQQHARKLKETEATGKWHIEQEKIRERARLQAEKMKKQQKEVSLQQALRSAKTPSQQLSIALQIENDPEANDTLKVQARQVALAAKLQILTNAGVRMPPQLPGLPPPSVMETINELRQMQLRMPQQQQQGQGLQQQQMQPQGQQLIPQPQGQQQQPGTNTGIPGVMRR